MKILIVASHNKNRFAPFILEQVNALQLKGIECQFFGVEGHGITGYIKNLPKLKQKIQEFHPDLIHAHYGLSSLLTNLQRTVPVVTTYHGSDINNPSALRFSKISMLLSAWNIFVSQRNIDIARPKRKYSLIPCGIDLPKDPSDLPDMSHILEPDKKHVLFSSSFDNHVKNYPLAREAIDLLNNNGTPTQLIELKNYTRDQVNSLMYACDAFLMTSFTEGSPQVIKEALACGCPIVSVDVGDVKEVTESVEGCFISDHTPESLATNLTLAFNFPKRTNGRQRITELGLTNDIVADKINTIYTNILSKQTSN